MKRLGSGPLRMAVDFGLLRGFQTPEFASALREQQMHVSAALFCPGELDGAAGPRFTGVLDVEHNYWPKMTTDFKDAAQRHWADAELLGSHGRLPNADHLYGFAAECAFKAVMVGLGMQLGADGKPAKPHAVHIHQLWNQFLTFANGKGQAGYAAMLQQSNPFSTWHESQRYWHSTGIGSASVNAHRAGAVQALGVLSQARQDGWVT